MQTKTHNTPNLVIVILLVLTMLGSGLQRQNAHALAQSFDLYAKAGSTTLPDGVTLTVWGYNTDNSSITKPGGETLIVNQGDTVSITLHNNLTEATALLIQGQEMTPDLTGAAAGGTATYSFTAGNPGTYLYEAGLLDNAQHQVAMGLYGALIVLPATAGQAYGDASTAYDDEAVLLLGEIDPNLNANPASFNMRDYHPRYWLINGLAYPDTVEIATAPGNRALLRYINVGFQPHSMSVLGLRQQIIALDGNPLNYSRTVVAETIPPGRSMDVITTIPASFSLGGKFAIFEANLIQHNSNAAGFGGMLTFLSLAPPPPPSGDTVGPNTSSVVLTPNKTNGSVNVALSASVSDSSNGGSNIQTAEYYIDSTSGTAHAMTAVVAPFDSVTEAVSATIAPASLAALSSGSHTIYVRGQDAAGNWGAFNSATLNLDKLGPATTGATVSPSVSNGSVNVALSATANDSANGNSNIAAAEYNIDGGTTSVMTVSNTSVAISSLSATIPAATVNGLAGGAHTVSIRSRDAFGNWGAFTTVSLTVDKTGPTTSGVTAAPNPNNGTLGINSSTPAVRLSASFTDPLSLSNISAAEGFIDVVGANGSGSVFIATDGVFNSSTENGYVNIPLTTINTLSNGNHTLYVHGKDSSGNWGTTSTTTLMVDKTKPVVGSVLAAPNPTNASNSNNTSFTLTASATDAAFGNTNITRAEWYEGADPGVGNGVPVYAADAAFNSPTESLTANIDFIARGWAPGNHTVYVRAMDAAGNWSSTASTVVNVVLPNNIFADSFQSGTTSAWSSVTGANISVNSGASLNGSPAFGMRAGLAGTALGYVTDLTPLADSSFHGRFYFNPNGALPNNNNSANGVTIFSGLNSANTAIFQVQFRRQNNGTYQVRLAVLRSGGTSTTNWYAISNASHSIEIAWQSGSSTSASFYTDGVLRQTLTGLNTNANKLESVRLGPSVGTVAGASGAMYFDAYMSTRNTVVGP